ncbi:unnamed protein product [Adineta steineri]|uniref:NADH dehydrogenase [ubiquinone] 1 alpha subcomplex subunit 9, mitochondrial n=1 Tax=Adineta steineri TaxID=433720 RepID=A0A815CJ19_9BILA|nr:unnamed protein product [Adineta steineri]CAF1280990.1 unnamed protein product [Adineta steineri]
MAKILVTGGTGVLGRALSNIFLANKTDFLITSRNQKNIINENDGMNSNSKSKWLYMDLSKNKGINKVFNNNIDTILHLASMPMQNIQGQPADVILTKNLLDSIPKQNIKHLIYISIVGIDKIPFTYYRGKLECERLIKASGIPYSILRATQFHGFVEDFAVKLLKFPICMVPKSIKVQPVQVEAVAMELNKILGQSPLNSTYEIGGKKIYEMKEIVDSLLNVRQEKKLMIPIPIMGKMLKAYAKGYGTCNNIALNSNTWEEYLASKYPK